MEKKKGPPEKSEYMSDKEESNVTAHKIIVHDYDGYKTKENKIKEQLIKESILPPINDRRGYANIYDPT